MGFISIFLAFTGYKLSRTFKFGFGLTFGGVSLFAGLISLIIGISMLHVEDVFDDKLLVQTACYDPEYAGLAYNEAISKAMCSEICPCDPGKNNETRNYWEGLGTKKLREFGRAISYDELNKR